MKNRILYIGIMLSTACVMQSCMKDKLSPTQLTSVTDASAFDTQGRIANQVISLYGAMKSGSFLGGRATIVGEIRGEEYDNVDANLVIGSDVYNMNLANSATNVTAIWAQGYYVINLANVFLDGMEAKGNTVAGTANAARYNGEARFVRALTYLTLLQYYAQPYGVNNGNTPGLPLRLKGITGAGQSALPKSTVAAVYAQILADLDFAEQNLPANNSIAFANTTRAHKNSAIALKTRVYLAMQNYPKVVEEANKLVPASAPFVAKSGVANALEVDIKNVFKTPYTTPESIFSLPMSATSGDFPGTQTQLAYYFYNPGSLGNAAYALLPTGIIGNANWKATDVRRSLIYNHAANSKQYMAKFTTTSPQYIDYIPVIRWSEVLLNLAEAKARINTGAADAQAIALLNAVRNRSDATTTFSPTTSADLISLILTERRIEFLGEGLRSFDITRLVQSFPAKGSAPVVAPSEQNYIFPTPSGELLLNPDITK